ncbi:hypothetical protein ACFY04_37065 [Streptomyces sp. NPDC001549]|uniref:hypothetical protein n=1 Tax=Streptomyces sp. NPDC001549 TaxID=3364586 RepID=UPI0036B2A863
MPIPAESVEATHQKVTMVHAMMLVCFIDGPMASQQIALIESYAKGLPEFHGRDFRQYYQAAKAKATEARGSLDRAVASVDAIESKELRRKTFHCCLELAHAAGKASSAQESLLTAIQHTLKIETELARTMQEIIAAKFDHTIL